MTFQWEPWPVTAGGSEMILEDRDYHYHSKCTANDILIWCNFACFFALIHKLIPNFHMLTFLFVGYIEC
jgi:hypothetical protein